MGDMGDFWRDVKDDMKEESRKKKSKNYDNGIKQLDENKILYELKNGGIHVIIYNGVKGKIDYYPSTGKFIIRDTGKKGRGINNLLKKLEKEK